MAVGLRRSVFVGRASELARLQGALEARGSCPGLFLAAEAGMGKTRLAQEFAALVRSRGALVTWGSCLESGAQNLPFAPFVEALDRLHDEVGGDDDLFRAGDRADLAALLPALGEQPRHSLPRIRVFESVRSLFDRTPDPTVCIVEDLHWADRSSLELFSYLVRRLRHGRTLLVATFRSDEVAGDHPAAAVVEELARTERAARIDLEPLEGAHIATMVRAMIPELPYGRVTEVVTRSEGNPFFAEALTSDPRPHGEGVPPTLRDLLVRRVEQAGQLPRKVLEIAALADRPIGVALFDAVWSGNAQELDRGLAAAIERGLLVEEYATSRIGLRHALVGEAIVERMSPLERARLHERFAVVLSANPSLGAPTEAGRQGELAVHWVAAGREREALAASVRAGDEAERVPARAEALAHYERALELWDRVPDAPAAAGIDHVVLLTCASKAAHLCQNARRAVELMRIAASEAERSEEMVRAGEAYATLADFEMDINEIADMGANAERAVALIPASPPSRERAVALRALGLGGHRGIAYAMDRCKEAAEIAHNVADLVLEARARSTYGSALWALDRETAGMAELKRAVELAELSGDPIAVRAAHYNRLLCVTQSADAPEAVERAVSEVLEAAQRLDFGDADDWSAYAEVESAWRFGRWSEIEGRIASAVERAGVDPSWKFLRARLAVMQGRLDEAESTYREILEQTPWHSDIANCHIGLATAACLRGKPRMALEEIDRAIDVLAGDYPINLAHASGWGLRAAADLAELGRARREAGWVEAAVAAGAQHRARLESAMIGTMVAGMGMGRTTQASCAWGMAEASRLAGDSDPDLWEAAAKSLAGGRYPDLEPYARFRLGEAQLARRMDRRLAARELRAAWDSASRLGMEPLAIEVEALAKRARIDLTVPEPEAPPVPVMGRSDLYGLSDRECEVLALLIEGRTNREIGEQLFISEKTASVHVTHILDKLGVNSRGAAAAFAVRGGLIPEGPDPAGARRR